MPNLAVPRWSDRPPPARSNAEARVPPVTSQGRVRGAVTIGELLSSHESMSLHVAIIHGIVNPPVVSAATTGTLVGSVDASVAAEPATGGIGLLVTTLLLGLRHGFDWDHIAAITDITSTAATVEVGEREHEIAHATHGHPLPHPHGGPTEIEVHALDPEDDAAPELPPDPAVRPRERGRALLRGTLYALGHALVVVALGLAALNLGAVLPDGVDPIMARVVGVTLVVLGIWVFFSLYQYARHGRPFRLRSRWMLVFDVVRHAAARFGAWLHGHEHARPIEMSSYGPRTAFGIGMIHGVGAETGSQALLIASVGGGAALGLGVPMLLTFVLGLVVSNSIVVLVTAGGFAASQARQRLYVVVGVLAGVFSLVVGSLFLLGAESVLPDLGESLRFLG